MNKNRGFTLVEVTIASFVMIVAIAGAFGFLRQSVVTGGTVNNQLVASYLAQEGVEIVRNIRDTNYVRLAGGGAGNWDDGLTGCSGGCEAIWSDSALAPAQTPLQKLAVITDASGTRYEYGGGTSTVFTRRITVTASGSQRVVVVEVIWQERGSTHSVQADTELYNWANL